MGPVFGGHDPGVCAFGCSAMALAAMGRNTASPPLLERAIALSEELGQANSRAHALLNALIVAQFSHDCVAVARYAQRAIELAEKYNLPPFRAHAAMVSGWAVAMGGDVGAGVAAMEVEYPRASAMGPFYRYYAALLAEGMEEAGRFADALALLRPALATVTEPGVGIFISELLRVQGLCLLGAGGGNEAEAMHSLRTAVAVAKQQGAALLELRAAVSLARAAAAIGRPDDGLDTLRAFCAAPPPEFDTANLTEARELLGS